MFGNLDAAGEPHVIVGFCIVEKALQPCDLARAADQAAVQADGKHLRAARLTFGIKGVKAVFQVLEELLALDVARRCGKAHVVGFQRVGDDQLVTRAHLAPIGQIVVVGVGNPVELAGFGGQIDGVHRTAPGVPAARRRAHDLGVQADGLGDLGALVLEGMSR